MLIRLVHADRRTDKHDKADNALCATSTRLLLNVLWLLLKCLYRLSFRSQLLDSWHIISRRRWRGVGVWQDGGS